ncbi:MAG: cytochrome c [Betaproteobacteria bacterium]|nr:cytochrome c [Betaproteobacteria bacterium]
MARSRGQGDGCVSAACRRPQGPRIALALAIAAAVSFPAGAGDPATKAKMELGRTVFTRIAQPQCGLCHALEDAGTTGTIGAKLEELRPDANRVAEAVRKGLGAMPAYAGKLTQEQIEAVAFYVSRAAAAN